MNSSAFVNFHSFFLSLSLALYSFLVSLFFYRRMEPLFSTKCLLVKPFSGHWSDLYAFVSVVLSNRDFFSVVCGH